MNQRMFPIRAAHGVSLMETMVASALAIAVIGSALQVFVTNHAYVLRQTTAAELLQDIRGGIDLFSAELRVAFPITVMHPEEIRFRGNVNDVRGRITVLSSGGHVAAQATPNSGWVKGKTVRLCSPQACEEHTLARDGTSGHLMLADALRDDFPEGSQIEVINEVRYYLNRNQPANWKIMREIDHGANPVMEHVEQFSLTYLKDQGAVATHADEVRLVNLVLRTSKNNGYGSRITQHHARNMGMRTL
jgi:hypothetical protein